MKSDQQLKFPKSNLRQFEENLRLEARVEGLKIDIKVKDNGDDTVDISWTVSEGTVPAPSTARAGGSGRGEREGLTVSAPITGPTPTAATSGSEHAPSASAPSASAGPGPLRPASPSGTTGPAPTAPALFNPPKGWMLGTLSSQFETGGRGPGTVSSGKNDPGGVSYGSYQMTSSDGGGTVRKFISDAVFLWRDRFANLTPGSEQFSAQWKALATEEPDVFFKAQHAFIERTHFAPLVQNIKSACALDVTRRSHGLQDVAWSTAVQHGPNTPVITRAIEAVGGVDALPPSDLDGDRRLIRAIYAERGRKSADGGLAYFPRVTDKRTQQALSDRFVNEARDALAMLAGDA